MKPLVSCLCNTYGRPKLLEEAIKCFLDQDYDNKELIVLNDQEGAILKLDQDYSDIRLINHPKRFETLGHKRNYIKSIARGDYYCIWDDDDLYTPWRISFSVKCMSLGNCDIAKSSSAFTSVHNGNYQIASNLFHSQAIITRQYASQNDYPLKSVAEDLGFEKKAKIKSATCYPFFWYVYRWGMKTYHVSGLGEQREKEAWELASNLCDDIKGECVISPRFHGNYWSDIEAFFRVKRKDKDAAEKWIKKIEEVT